MPKRPVKKNQKKKNKTQKKTEGFLLLPDLQ